MNKLWFVTLVVLLIQSCSPASRQESLPLRLDFEPGGQAIAVMAGEELLTLYRFADTLYKPLFFPVNTIGGMSVNRGYPFDPRPRESVDHPHQSGAWFTFGDVNGIDFWNNSNAIPTGEKYRYGHIRTDSVVIDRETGNDCGFTAYNSWLTQDNDLLLKEKTGYRFTSSESSWALKRNTTLTAQTGVHFGDNKEGLFGIRLAREFQSDVNHPRIILGPDLYPVSEKVIDDDGKTGYYTSSEGREGKEVWGTANAWVAVSAVMQGDSVMVVMFDHPRNPGFPSHWHARDYGLFSVNNFGRKSFIDSLPALSTDLAQSDSVTFIHEMIVKSSGCFKKQAIDSLYDEFSAGNRVD